MITVVCAFEFHFILFFIFHLCIVCLMTNDVENFGNFDVRCGYNVKSV